MRPQRCACTPAPVPSTMGGIKMAATERRRPAGNDAFHRRFTAPEERKQRVKPWCGGFRWFASENVVQLERYRTEEEWRKIRARLWPK